MTDPFVAELGRQRILPVLRTSTADEAFEAAATAVDAGLSVVELTATTPQWAQALLRVREERPSARVGVGTVTTAEVARVAIAAGAAFVVSPWPVPAVREVARQSGTPLVEGAFSPGEVANCATRGPVKVFPAHVGGPGYLRSLRQVLPDAVLVPTGGIGLDDAATWLAAGAHAVGIGSDLFVGDLATRLATALDHETVDTGAIS